MTETSSILLVSLSEDSLLPDLTRVGDGPKMYTYTRHPSWTVGFFKGLGIHSMGFQLSLEACKITFLT